MSRIFAPPIGGLPSRIKKSAAPIIYTGASVGPFGDPNGANPRWLSSATGPTFGPGKTIGLLFDDSHALYNSDEIVLANAAIGGSGYFFEKHGTNQIYLGCYGGGGTTSGAQLRAADKNCVFVSWEGVTAPRFSANGGATLAHGNLSYVAPGAGASFGVGAFGDGSLPYLSGNLVGVIELNRVASDGEKEAWSNCVNCPVNSIASDVNHFTADVLTDSSATFIWLAEYYTQGDVTCPSTGSLGLTLSVHGVPLKNDLSHRVISIPSAIFTSGFADSKTSIVEAGDNTRHNELARLLVTTDATRLIIDTVSTYAQDENPSKQGQIGIIEDGSFVQELALTRESVRQVSGVRLDGSSHDLQIVEGPQSSPSLGVIQGSYLMGLRVEPPTASLSISIASAPARRLTFAPCDSITSGFVASPITQLGLVPRLRVDFPGGVSIEGWGFRALKDDSGDLDALAARIALLSSDVLPGGQEDIWIPIGTNDHGEPSRAQSAANYGAQYHSLLLKLRALRPLARIIVQTILSKDADGANGFGDDADDYRLESIAAADGVSNVIVVNGPDIMLKSDLIDGLHPGNVGNGKYHDYVILTVT